MNDVRALSLVQSQVPWHCLLSATAESSWWGCPHPCGLWWDVEQDSDISVGPL